MKAYHSTGMPLNAFYKSFLLGNDYAAVTYLKLQLKCNTVIPLQQLKDWKIELGDNCRRLIWACKNTLVDSLHFVEIARGK